MYLFTIKNYSMKKSYYFTYYSGIRTIVLQHLRVVFSNLVKAFMVSYSCWKYFAPRFFTLKFWGKQRCCYLGFIILEENWRLLLADSSGSFFSGATRCHQGSRNFFGARAGSNFALGSDSVTNLGLT